MSSASHTPAAVFSSSPQSVEVYERGAWWPGSMLGWRHDPHGTCQAWVRVEFAGIVEDAWVDLGLLRLPEAPGERHLTPVREPKGAVRGAPTGARAAVGPASAPEVTRTQRLPLVREGVDGSTGMRALSTGGRRRAPEAGDESPAPVATAGSPAVDGRPLGRHRAPAEQGRHRAADTGLSGAVPAPPVGATRAARAWSPEDWDASASRSELPPAGPVVRPTSPRPRADQDLLTRPVLLEDGVGSARRPGRDSLTGV